MNAINRRQFISLAAAAALLTATRTQAQQPRLIAYGDSITVGVGASAPGRSYAAIVATTLGAELDNRARSATLIASWPGRATPVAPGDSAIVLPGYNDMRIGTDPAAYTAALDALLATLRAEGGRVVVGTCLRMTEAGYGAYAPQWAHGSDGVAGEYSARARASAAAHGCLVAETSATYDPAHNSDLIHPDDAGHAEIAGAMLAALQPRILLPLVEKG